MNQFGGLVKAEFRHRRPERRLPVGSLFQTIDGTDTGVSDPTVAQIGQMFHRHPNRRNVVEQHTTQFPGGITAIDRHDTVADCSELIDPVGTPVGMQQNQTIDPALRQPFRTDLRQNLTVHIEHQNVITVLNGSAFNAFEYRYFVIVADIPPDFRLHINPDRTRTGLPQTSAGKIGVITQFRSSSLDPRPSFRTDTGVALRIIQRRGNCGDRAMRQLCNLLESNRLTCCTPFHLSRFALLATPRMKRFITLSFRPNPRKTRGLKLKT